MFEQIRLFGDEGARRGLNLENGLADLGVEEQELVRPSLQRQHLDLLYDLYSQLVDRDSTVYCCTRLRGEKRRCVGVEVR